jgi:tRNA A-37 threonylcarbamoyl transferase component Bud32
MDDRNQIEARTHFAADMLRDMIMSLKTLHSLGYSHGDIKGDNICCRLGKDNKYRFTLIDFGTA